MKNNLLYLLGVIMIAASCADGGVVGDGLSVTEVPLREMRLSALPGPSKTMLDGSCEVLWQSGDEICVLDGYGTRRFRTEDSGSAATFEGSAAEVAGLRMVYPYDKRTYGDGDCVVLTLPGRQVACEGTFQRGANLSLAEIDGSGAFRAKNLCALVCLKICRGDIVSVRLRPVGGSPLSGRVKVGFDGDGIPVVLQALEPDSSVELVPQGEVIAPGTYYVTVLPGLLSSGLKIDVTLKGGTIGSKVVGVGTDLERSSYMETDADKGLAYSKDEKRIVVIYGDSITHINVFNHLQSLLDTKACDVMDGDTLKHISYRVVMAGRSGERPIQIVCRQGALPLYIKGPFSLPASAAVTSFIGENFYTTMDEDAQNLGAPEFPVNVDLGGESTTGWTGCTNPFVLDGIPCTVKSGQYISRVESSREEKTFTEDYTLVRTHVDYEYSNPYISTVYMGTNGKYIYENPSPDGHTWKQLGDFVQMMIDHAHGTRWVVCGYHSRVRWTQGGMEYMAGRFGDKYLDLKTEGIRKVDDICARIDYTLTEDDRIYLSNGEWPAGWQDLNNPVHPSPVGHKAYATLLFEKMEELGYL